MKEEKQGNKNLKRIYHISFNKHLSTNKSTSSWASFSRDSKHFFKIIYYSLPLNNQIWARTICVTFYIEKMYKKVSECDKSWSTFSF